MKGGCDSRVACVITMEGKHRGNKQKKKCNHEPDRLSKEFDELQLSSPSPCSKAFCSCAGSISMISCLSKAASMKSYTIAPFSPEYSLRVKSMSSRGHSGPIISIIPKEAMRGKKGGGFESQEPTSPKVSCIGQVKLKAKGSYNANCKDEGRSRGRFPLPPKEKRAELGRMIKLRRLFLGKKQTEKPVLDQLPKAEGNDCPSPGQMKWFSSSRESPALANVYAHPEDLVNKNDECGVFSEDDEAYEVNLSSVIAELKSRTNSEIHLWERSHVECTETPSPQTR